MIRPTRLLTAIAVLSACAPASSTSEPEAPAESVTIEVTRSSLDQALPRSSDLLVYDQTERGIPFTARYPESMQVSATGSGEGIGAFFTFRPRGDALDSARVHIFLPAGTVTAAEQESFVTGANGLMASNGWTQVARQPASSSRFRQKWVQVVIDFKAEQGVSGHILLGDAEGHAIQVTLLYPESLSETYWLAVRPILDTFAIKTESAVSSAAASTTDAETATDPASRRDGPN